uniref:Uncharacterized protein n=1 Tax=Compsopogon caeruleus TaxID=31354 RepID=A0A7S1XGV6_9RHOD|mmetsp:Transcript_8119/g.16361  ORF Transcript_8119/g.16361 Transcript_8119/m.16361 type:complete len:483 (+) Transcript_8119:194-1642(+)
MESVSGRGPAVPPLKSSGSSSTQRNSGPQQTTLAAKLASMPYSFSQQMPAPPRKKTPFERNFPELNPKNEVWSQPIPMLTRSTKVTPVVKSGGNAGLGTRGSDTNDPRDDLSTQKAPNLQGKWDPRERSKAAADADGRGNAHGVPGSSLKASEAADLALFSKLVPFTSAQPRPANKGTLSRSHLSRPTRPNQQLEEAKETQAVSITQPTQISTSASRLTSQMEKLPQPKRPALSSSRKETSNSKTEEDSPSPNPPEQCISDDKPSEAANFSTPNQGCHQLGTAPPYSECRWVTSKTEEHLSRRFERATGRLTEGASESASSDGALSGDTESRGTGVSNEALSRFPPATISRSSSNQRSEAFGKDGKPMDPRGANRYRNDVEMPAAMLNRKLDTERKRTGSGPVEPNQGEPVPTLRQRQQRPVHQPAPPHRIEQARDPGSSPSFLSLRYDSNSSEAIAMQSSKLSDESCEYFLPPLDFDDDGE